jgi:hypothetical protein
MCKFFSALSNGRGKVWFWTVEDIAQIMSTGNEKQYQPNSHSSIASYFKLDEDKLNKWEYDADNKKLVVDLMVTKDDTESVKRQIENYLKKRDLIWCRNFYGFNTGHSNSGHRNSGNWNTGNRNSGHRNSGNRNSGNWNTGYWNSGYWNSGHSNSGNSNSGNWNTGNWNSGYWNSGAYHTGFFNTIKQPPFLIFNKPCKKKRDSIKFPRYFYNIKLTYCYEYTDELRIRKYKEAWKIAFKEASKKEVKQTIKLPNFNYRIFYQITGITKTMINKRLKGAGDEPERLRIL